MEKRIAHVGVGQEFRMVGGYYGEGDRIDSWLAWVAVLIQINLALKEEKRVTKGNKSKGEVA